MSDHYMGVIAHWIDDSWNIQKRVLAYREFNVAHNATNIASKIISILHEYDLDKKIFSIGFDNATANTASLPTIKQYCQPSLGGKFFHIRCICHVLNLCVQDGIEYLQAEIEPIREAIKNIVRHTSVIKQWSRFCKSKGIRPKKFTLEVSTRWNSTYKLLVDSYNHRELLAEFYTQLNCGIQLFPTYWDTCINLFSVLQTFDEATRELSGVYYPTSPLALDHCVKIALILVAAENDEKLGACVRGMKTKWLKYFTNIPDIFLVAKLLDPRIREDGLQTLLTMYYSALFSSDDSSCPEPSTIVSKSKENLIQIFREYKNYLGLNEPSDVQHPTSTSSSSDTFTNSALSQFYQFYNVRTSKRARSGTDFEVENFLTSAFEGLDFDNNGLLGWWARRANIFPVLSLLAKEVFAAPASNVSVESCFSVGSYMMDARRESLTVENFEAQVLLNDWTRALKREQQIDPDDDEQVEGDFYGYSTSSNSPPTP